MRKTYPRPERMPLPGERVRTDEDVFGVVVVVLPSRAVVVVRDNANVIHQIPIEDVSVVDAQRPRSYH